MSAPWEREWTAEERRALFEAAETLAKNCHAEWYGNWPQLRKVDETLLALREVAK